jgi:hypothetical protein
VGEGSGPGEESRGIAARDLSFAWYARLTAGESRHLRLTLQHMSCWETPEVFSSADSFFCRDDKLAVFEAHSLPERTWLSPAHGGRRLVSEQFHCAVFPALAEQFSSCLLTLLR